MSIYIVPRATKDMDFVVQLTPADIQKIAAHFTEGYYCDKEAMLESLRRKIIFNIIEPATGFKADFIPISDTEFAVTEFSRRIQKDFMGMPVYIVSPEDLIISKIIWIQSYQSAVQMEDIKNLQEVEGLDMTYILAWVKKLGLSTFDLIV